LKEAHSGQEQVEQKAATSKKTPGALAAECNKTDASASTWTMKSHLSAELLELNGWRRWSPMSPMLWRSKTLEQMRAALEQLTVGSEASVPKFRGSW